MVIVPSEATNNGTPTRVDLMRRRKIWILAMVFTCSKVEVDSDPFAVKCYSEATRYKGLVADVAAGG